MLNVNLNKIENEIAEALDEFRNDYTKEGIAEIVRHWYKANASLLYFFSKHPRWDNDCVALLFDADYNRDVDKNKAADMIGEIWNKARKEVMRRGGGGYIGHWNFDELPVPEQAAMAKIYRVNEECNWRASLSSVTVTEQTKQCLVTLEPKVRIGQKATKVWRKIFEDYGLNIYPEFEHDYAIFADAMSPMAIKRHTALSFHPCDYLLMSNGLNWRSCHLIDGGEWQGGTLSYMLDDVSAILYTVDKSYDNSNKDIWKAPKINRMVCAFQNNQILFSRLYPSYENKEMRENFRHAIQKIVADIKGVPNLWQAPIKLPNDARYVRSAVGAMQYADYSYPEYLAELSVLKHSEPEKMLIGTYGICPVCGAEYSECGELTCGDCHSPKVRCEDCGEFVDEDDVVATWDGHYVCQGCIEDHYTYCYECEEYVSYDDVLETVNGESLCPHCAQRYYTQCENCGGYVRDDEAVVTMDGANFCERCAEDNTGLCGCCGDVYQMRNLTRDVVSGEYYCEDCMGDVLQERNEEPNVVEIA